MLVLAAVASGCGSADNGVSVRGRVVYQEKPVANGALTFFPSGGRPVTAPLSDEGAYACQLPQGEYRVVVAVGVRLPAGWKEGDPVPPPAINLPAHYASRLQTPLTLSVSEEAAGEAVDFKLP